MTLHNSEAEDDVLSGGDGLADVLDPLPHRVPAPKVRSGSSPHPSCEFKPTANHSFTNDSVRMKHETGLYKTREYTCYT